MSDLTTSASLLTESQASSPSTSSTLSVGDSFNRRRLAFRPQSVKITGKPYRSCVVNNSNNSVGDVGTTTSLSGDGYSPGVLMSRAAAEDSLSRIFSPSHSNPPPLSAASTMGEPFRVVALNGGPSSSTSGQPPTNPKARRRLVTNWTFPETLIFYEALKQSPWDFQYGKDFDSIAKFMSKRKCSKDKDQVRNYYFNAFKIWKQKAHLEESDWGGVPRDARELFVIGKQESVLSYTFYCRIFLKLSLFKRFPLLNFSVLNGCEWRKRTDDAHFDASRFRTLILDGATSVRVKKKAVTIRTPYCPCLLKFFPYDRRNAVIPSHLSVRLTPHRFVDRNFVLACEQNPLLQIRANINDKIVNVFTLLERKWSAPLNRLVSDALETTAVGDSVSASGAALRLRVSDNVQIHKVEVQLNDCPAMSLNKLKRDYDVDSARTTNAPVALSAGTQVDGESADSGGSAQRTSFAAFSSADENSNEAPPPKTPTAHKFGGKPKDANVIMIGQAATAVFDVDEMKLREGLTRDSVGNATLLQLFYLCGMVREIPLSYELIDMPPNVDLSWRMFVSLISRDYGELTAKAIQRNDAERRAAADSRLSAAAVASLAMPSDCAMPFVGGAGDLATPSAVFSQPPSQLPSSCSIGDLLGVTRRKRKLATSRGKPAASIVAAASATASTTNGLSQQSGPVSLPFSSSIVPDGEPSLATTATRKVHSEIVEAENEQFLRQLRAINQPSKRRVQRQVKVVPNRPSAGKSSQLLTSSMARHNAVSYAPTISMTGKPIGVSPCTSTTNVLQTTDSALSVNNTIAYVISPRKDLTTGNYFLESGQPLVVDESQLSTLLYSQQLNRVGGQPIVAYLSAETGQLIGVDPNTTYVAVNLTTSNPTISADSVQQQYSNLTECTAEGFSGGAGGSTMVVHPIDFSHMAEGSSTPTTYMSILDTSPTVSVTYPLRPIPTSTINTAFRSPTRAAGRETQRAGVRQSQSLQSDGLARPRDAGDDQLAMADESASVASIGADLSIDFPMFSGFASSGANSNMAAGGASNSARTGASNANLIAQPTSFVLLDASPSSKTLPEDVRHAYELMLKENSVDYCRNFAQLTRKMDIIQADSNNPPHGPLPATDGTMSETAEVATADVSIVEPAKKRDGNQSKAGTKYGRAVAPKKD